MPILQYETQVSPEGYVTIPPIPEYHDRKVIVSVEEDRPLGDDWRPNPATVRQFFESRKITVELTDEEIEELKHERRMRKMR